MFGAIKFLLSVGIGVAGLVALAGKASAKSLPDGGSGGAGPSPGLPRRSSTKPGKLTLDQVARQMTDAIATADPKVLEAAAAKLDAAGFPDQAKDLRGVAAQLAQVAAQAGGVKAPVIPPPTVATPPAAMPQASPADPAIRVIPPPSPAPPITLPEVVITAGAPGGGGARPTPVQPTINNAALDTVQRAVVNLQSSKKRSENKDLVAQLQAQEKALGHYESFDPMKAGTPGTVDGLYGPGTAFAIAKFYGIVPPNPFYWPTNYAPALSLYKARLLDMAANDPARAEEWRSAAQRAKVM